MRFQKAEKEEGAPVLSPTSVHQKEVEERIEQVHAPPPPPLMTQEDHPEDDDYEDDEYDYYDEDDEYDYYDDDDYEDEDREEEILNSDDEEEDDKEEKEEEADEEAEKEEEKEDDDDEEEERSSSAVIPTSASPYMVVHHGTYETEQTFYSISKGSCCDRSVPEMYGTTCCASSNGWLVMLESSSDRSSRFCFLLNSVSFEEIDLPSIKTSYECDYCILTSSPPDCVVMFLSTKDNSCLFCQPNDKRWTRKILGRKWDAEGSNTSCFRVPFGVVSCERKIYINYGHGQGMKILDYKIDNQDDDSRIVRNRFTVEKIKFNRRSLMDSFDIFITDSRTSNYLVESCGEVFLVVRIYIGFANMKTYRFSVYKLIKSSSLSSSKGGRIAWKKVGNLGDDRVFFVARSYSISASASKAGLMENHIYFFHPHDERYLYRFNMDIGSICKTLCFPHLVGPCNNEPYWMISNFIL